MKNTVISTLQRQILFLGHTVWGSQHDYGLFKTEFPPELGWFARFQVWLDLGYLGFADDFQTLHLHIPYKRPRKSKTTPTPTLTDEQKAYNRTVSQTRIVIEHVLASLKHWAILSAQFRHHRHNLDDTVIYLAAGLHNFLLNSP